MEKKPTLKDIASICGCSVTTVSRALQKSPTISEATQKKIAVHFATGSFASLESC